MSLSMLVAIVLTQQTPVFTVHALGVLGGDDDSNLSAYAVGTNERPDALLVEAGAFTRGLTKWKLGAAADQATASQKVAVLKAFFANLSGVLVSHAHLDHLSGLMLTSPVLMGAGRSQSLPLVVLPRTAETLRQHLFGSQLWVDLTRVPAGKPALTLLEVPVATPQTLGDFTIETIALSHAIPSAAFLIGTQGASYLHLGDTGPTDAVWKRVQPLLKKRVLRGIAIEVSFASSDETLAIQTGHLTPKLLVKELTKLTGATDVAGIAKALGPCRVMAIHLKATSSDAVITELRALAAEGLPMIVPDQGGEYRF